MIRTLLATTAVAAVLALPVLAQDATPSVDSPELTSSEMAPDASSVLPTEPMDAMPSSEPMESPMASSVAPVAPFDITTGYTQVDTDRLASRIIGQPVYDGPSAEANNLGNINDLVVDQNGDVQAVVIGVGGFLGIGEKQVAVAFSALDRVVAEDSTERFVIQTTVEQLTAAPDFVTVDDTPADGVVPDAPAM